MERIDTCEVKFLDENGITGFDYLQCFWIKLISKYMDIKHEFVSHNFNWGRRICHSVMCGLHWMLASTLPCLSILALPMGMVKSLDCVSSDISKATPYINSFSRNTTATHKADVQDRQHQKLITLNWSSSMNYNKQLYIISFIGRKFTRVVISDGCF